MALEKIREQNYFHKEMASGLDPETFNITNPKHPHSIIWSPGVFHISPAPLMVGIPNDPYANPDLP